MTLVLLLIFPASSFAGDVWRITSLEWPPYSNSKAPAQGSSIQALRTLLEQADIKLVVEFYPWERAKSIARKDGYVGYYPAWPGEELEGFVGSLPVDWSQIGVMTYAGSGLTWTNLDKLFHSKVGLITSYNYPKDIMRSARKTLRNIDPTPNEIALLKKLSDRRIKAAITDPAVMLYLAKQERIDNIQLLQQLGQIGLVLAVHDTPKNRQRLQILNDLIQKKLDQAE